MKIEKQKIEIMQDGKTIDRAYLNRGYQRGYFYFEHDGIAAELAQGKPKPQAKAEELRRAAITLFNGAMRYFEELSKLDAIAADTLFSEFYSSLTVNSEGKPSRGANLKSLERRAAAMFFAWQDAEAIVSDKAGIDYAQMLTNICFTVNEDSIQGAIPAGSRIREALRRFKDTNAKAQQEAQRELSLEGRAIFDMLEAASAALEECYEQGGPDEDEKADKIMEEAEAPLNALALKDPEEATRIFHRSGYFDYVSSEGEIYLGAGVFCRRDQLPKLDTPEKRAVFVKARNILPEDLPAALESGEIPADIYNELLPIICDNSAAIRVFDGAPEDF